MHTQTVCRRIPRQSQLHRPTHPIHVRARLNKMAPYPFWTRRPQCSLTDQSLFQSIGNPSTETGTSTSTHITTSNTSVRLLEPKLDRANTIPSKNEENISETQRVITKLNANGYPTSFINSCQLRLHHNSRQPGDKNTKRDFVVLPYCLFEKLARLVGKHNIKLSYKPVRAIASFFKKPKDPLSKESATEAVYKINCNNCNAVYIGQTSRALRTRMPVHSRAIATLDRNSLLVKHTQHTGYDFDLDNVTIVDKCPQWRNRLVLEAWHSAKNKNAINEHLYEFQLVLFNCFKLAKLHLFRKTTEVIETFYRRHKQI